MVSSMKLESLFCSARALCFPEISLFSLKTLLTNVEVNSALLASLHFVRSGDYQSLLKVVFHFINFDL